MAEAGERRSGRAVLGELVEQFDRVPPYDIVVVCQQWLRDRAGARRSELLLVDYDQTALEPAHGDEAASRTGHRHLVGEGAAGTAYREQRVVQELGPRCSVTVFLPVTMRTERLGVMVVEFDGSAPVDSALLTDAARLLALVLVGARRYTDRFEVLRRNKDLELAAEIQWELLPVLAYELPEFSIAGELQPTYDIGGDTFDYAVSATRLTVSITDAVGRGLHAALLASLAVTAMRNTRRSGRAIGAQAANANSHLVEQFPGPHFVTGLLLEIDLPGGSVRALNAGHPPPLLRRDGAVAPVPLTPDLPLGLADGAVYREQHFQLRSGDRLLLLTDGITEAHCRGGPEFGDENVSDLLRSLAHLPPTEFVRRLSHAVVDHCGDITDDATAVCLDWTRPRDSSTS
jgi:serine phosphatase RsbU (regulator of sigma subunit)